MKLSELKSEIKRIALDGGAKLVGIGSRERLKDAPPSGDMDYMLPGAQSCIIWAIPQDIEMVKRYLSKEERWSYRENLQITYQTQWRIAKEIVNFIKKNSKYKAVPVAPNAGYRDFGFKNKQLLRLGRLLLWLGIGKKVMTHIIAKVFGERVYPEFSLRYGGVAAGIGRLGWSGCLMTKEYGSAVYLGGAITTAPLEADPLLEENPCNKCLTCWNACPTGLFSSEEAESPVIIGGREEIYSKRNSYARCFFGCGGMAGLGQEKNWSTWTPDTETCLKELPEAQITDEKWRRDYIWKIFFDRSTPAMQRKWNRTTLNQFMIQGIKNNVGHPSLTPPDTHPTCGVCQAVCVADPKQRRELLKLLKTGGIVHVDDEFHEYIKRTDESGKQIIYYPPSEEEYYHKMK